LLELFSQKQWEASPEAQKGSRKRHIFTTLRFEIFSPWVFNNGNYSLFGGYICFATIKKEEVEKIYKIEKIQEREKER
jgi:hypothetical protein